MAATVSDVLPVGAPIYGRNGEIIGHRAAGPLPPLPPNEIGVATPTQALPTPVSRRVDPATGSQVGLRRDDSTPSSRYQVNPVYWQEMQRRNPQVAKWIANASNATGVPPEVLAYHKWKESTFNSTAPIGGSGEHGIFQFMPGTRDMIDPQHKFNPDDGQDSAMLAAHLIDHLAYTRGLGMGTPAQIAAYNGSGPKARAYAADAYRDGISGRGGGGPLPPSAFAADPSRVNPGQIVQAAAQGGPDAAMRYLVEAAPRNLDMNDKWRHLESLLVQAAIMKGDFAGAAAARDFVGHLSYDGTNQHLMAAYNALNAGLGNLAAQHLAAAHAFFPDGSTGQFFSDGKNVYAKERDNANPEDPSNVTRITPDGIAGYFNQTKDPITFLKVLSERQKDVAQRQHLEAQTAFEEQRPELMRRGQNLTYQARSEATASQDKRAAERNAVEAGGQEARFNANVYRTNQQAYDAEQRRRIEEEKYLTEENRKTQEAAQKAGAGGGESTVNKIVGNEYGERLAGYIQGTYPGKDGSPPIYKRSIDPDSNQVAIRRVDNNEVVAYLPPSMSGYFTGNWQGNAGPRTPVPPNAWMVRSTAPMPVPPQAPAFPGYQVGGGPRPQMPVPAGAVPAAPAGVPALVGAVPATPGYAPAAPVYAPAAPVQQGGALGYGGDYGSNFYDQRPDLWGPQTEDEY